MDTAELIANDGVISGSSLEPHQLTPVGPDGSFRTRPRPDAIPICSRSPLSR